MIHKFTLPLGRLLGAALLLTASVLLPRAHAAVISDDFSKALNTSDWSALGYACLTARSSSTTNPYSSIPGCVASPVDAAGSGSLRLTPNVTYQRGSIVSNYTFPTNQGLQVTFTTYTFGGDKGGTGKLGADGMSFFLMDGSVGTKLGTGTNAIDNLGASGGALSYSCSNGNGIYSGLTGAYLGLGMDEYGNFLNDGDNTKTGIAAQTANTSTNGYNSWGSGNYQSNRIGLRGAGNVSWYWLNQNYPVLFPSTFNSTSQQLAVQGTCKSGFLWDARGQISQSITGATVNGNTLSLTMPSTIGYANGDSVTIGGTIAATAVTRNIATSPAPSFSGSTLTFTGTGGTYAVGQIVTLGGTITVTPAAQPISSFSNYSSSARTFRININTGSGGTTSSFAVNSYAYVSGITSNSGYANNFSYQIAGVSTGYITVNCGSNSCGSTYPTIGSGTALLATSSSGSSGVPVSISGSSYTTVTGTTGSTVKFNLPTTISAVSNSSGTVALPVPTVTGAAANLVVSNLSATGFDVTLNYPAATITNTSGTIAGSGHATSTAVQDYAVIPGGYWVLPETQPIANETVTTRAQATPITYKLTITPGGNLSFLYSYNGGAFQQVLTNWPITSNNGALPASFRFGFSGATGGSYNYHDITCFLAEPVTSASGAGGNAVQSGQFKTSTQVYTASYDSYFWTGSVTAVPISLSTTVVGGVAFGSATWDANCVLTGGGCSTTGVAVTAQDSTKRALLTWNGSQGIPLTWSSTSTALTSAQQTVLNSSDSYGMDRVGWLRGDRSREQAASSAGPLRTRGGVLGDVVDSSPTWVGPPTANYGKGALTDGLYGSTAGLAASSETSHADFNTSLAQRTHVVYVGSNDGFLHAFRTGSTKADGTYDSTYNDGQELLGFLPASVLADSRVVGLTQPTYGHDYFADAAPGYGDLYYGGAWHTWLVSGMGPGGKEIFALDITDPAAKVSTNTGIAFSEANASSVVKGDWTAASLTALTCVNATTNCGDNLGYTYGTPIIRRLHNGKWAFIFGNGYGSKNAHAGIFVGVVAPATTTSPAVTAGSVSFYWLDTGSGTTANPNGIAYVSGLDLDGDRITDYLYAGDLLGKVWRFDLTSSKPTDWAASSYGQTNSGGVAIPGPLFDAGATHPITTQIITATVAQTGLGTRVMLGFGTGQGVPFTTSSAEVYASASQSLYGIWDWDMTAWNNGTTTAGNVVIPASSTKMQALSQISSGTTARTFGKNTTDMAPFTVTQTAATSTSTATRSAPLVSQLCWQGSTACASGNNKYGWYFDFPTTGEQLIYSPAFENGAIVVNTTIPPGTGAVGQCTPVSTTGWTMAFNLANGGGFLSNVFADASGSYAAASDKSTVVGVQLNLVGKPGLFTVGAKRVVAGSNSSGINDGKEVDITGGIQVKRVSWEQIR